MIINIRNSNKLLDKLLWSYMNNMWFLCIFMISIWIFGYLATFDSTPYGLLSDSDINSRNRTFNILDLFNFFRLTFLSLQCLYVDWLGVFDNAEELILSCNNQSHDDIQEHQTESTDLKSNWYDEFYDCFQHYYYSLSVSDYKRQILVFLLALYIASFSLIVLVLILFSKKFFFVIVAFYAIQCMLLFSLPLIFNFVETICKLLVNLARNELRFLLFHVYTFKSL